jgi:hypothetical protein
MLSRLHRRAEALDEACLRAQGHPHDYAIQQELLSALEWDASLHPEHARPVIRHLFRRVHDHSADLAKRIPSHAAPITHINTLRQELAKLVQVLAVRHREPRPD